MLCLAFAGQLPARELPVEDFFRDDGRHLAVVGCKEGHGFRIEKNRIEFYRKVEAFLKQHLK